MLQTQSLEWPTQNSVPARIAPLPGQRITSPELRSLRYNPIGCVRGLIDLGLCAAVC